MTAREHSLDLLRRIAASLPVDIEAGSDAESPAPGAGVDGTDAAGAPVLAWNELNQCTLTFDEDVALVMSFDEDEEDDNEEAGVFLLTWVLGDLPEEADERIEVMTGLLVANHEWNTTEGGTLGLDEDTSLVTLCYRIDLPLEPPDLIDTIVPRLFNVSRHWANILNSEEPSPEEDEPAEAAPEAPPAHVATPIRGGSVRDRL